MAGYAAGSLLFGLRPTDAGILGSAAALLAAVTIAASLPAGLARREAGSYGGPAGGMKKQKTEVRIPESCCGGAGGILTPDSCLLSPVSCLLLY